MPAHVRVKNFEALREHVVAAGMGIEVAAKAGISPQRLSQLLSGAAPSISVEQAVDLERAVGCRPGTLFHLPQSALLRPYLTSDEGEEPQDPAPVEPPPATTEPPTSPSTPE